MINDPSDLMPVGPRRGLFAVIPAGGSGARMQTSIPKQYLSLGEHTVLWCAVQAVMRSGPLACVVVVAKDDPWVDQAGIIGLDRVLVSRTGGATRCESVMSGLQVLLEQGGADPNDWVLVHDAARPGLPADALMRLVDQAVDHPVGGLLALQSADTVVLQHENSLEVVPRQRVWMAQTPQMFRIGALVEALRVMPEATDESSAMQLWATERGLAKPLLVRGDRKNFKITAPGDLEIMRDTMRAERSYQAGADAMMRVGQGYDVHALVPGRALIIGGVKIEHPLGLLGHSDADVLLHAITDALLGAAGLGDIGRQFPDTDPAFSGADSRVLMRNTMEKVRQAGYQVGNVDASVIAQAPRLAGYIAAMETNIAEDLQCSPGSVNIKAKTSEKLGFVGRQEGIEAHANVLLVPLPASIAVDSV